MLSGLVIRLVMRVGEDRKNSRNSRMESGLDCLPHPPTPAGARSVGASASVLVLAVCLTYILGKGEDFIKSLRMLFSD